METLQRLGHEENVIVSVDGTSDAISAVSSRQSVVVKPRTIEYLNKGR